MLRLQVWYTLFCYVKSAISLLQCTFQCKHFGFHLWKYDLCLLKLSILSFEHMEFIMSVLCPYLLNLLSVSVLSWLWFIGLLLMACVSLLLFVSGYIWLESMHCKLHLVRWWIFSYAEYFCFSQYSLALFLVIIKLPGNRLIILCSAFKIC